SLQDIQLPLTF
nr:immunoglobulin light chain junction region [Macaca mulatta]